MIQVGMFEAKTNFSRLIEELVLGETDYITILKNHRPVARIIAELADGMCYVGNPLVEECGPSEVEDLLHGVRADETSQSSLVVDDSPLPEPVESLGGGVHVHLE